MLKVVEPNKDLWESAVEFAKEIKNSPTGFDIYASKHLINNIENPDAYFDIIEQGKLGNVTNSFISFGKSLFCFLSLHTARYKLDFLKVPDVCDFRKVRKLVL